MKTLTMIIRLVRRRLIWILTAYWVTFAFYTAEKFLTGGSVSVVSWYEHIASSFVRRGDAWFLTPWSWNKFLAQQATILAVTLALYFFEWRHAKHRVG